MPPGTAMISVTREGHQRFQAKNSTSAHRTTHDFLVLPLCPNNMDPIHRDQPVDAICIRVNLTYDKQSTVMCDHIVVRRHVGLCRNVELGGALFVHDYGVKAPLVFKFRTGA